jgi:hypothetical protein
MGHHHENSITDSKVDNIRTDGFDDPRAFASQFITIDKTLGLEDILE